MMTWITPLCLAVGLVLAAPPALAQKSAPKNVEPRKELPCWYLFFSTGKTPNRQVFMLDGRHKQVGANVFEVQCVTLLETPTGEFDHWAGTLQYQATPEQVALAKQPMEKLQPLMKAVKVRTVSGYQMHADGKVVPAKPTEWSAFKTPIDLLGFRIACDPKAMEETDRYGMVFAGSLFRPIDAVDLVRKVLPNIKDLKDAQ